jgi:hypothetical protein
VCSGLASPGDVCSDDLVSSVEFVNSHRAEFVDCFLS